MQPLYDFSGQVVAFIEGTRIISPSGESLAWLDNSGNVYNYAGDHLGWWSSGHVRGPDGGVIVWSAEAAIPGVTPRPPLRL
jgi:hypothetical protein